MSTPHCVDLPTEVTVDIGPLSPADVVAVARYGAPVQLSEAAIDGIRASRKIIEDLASDTQPHYGISTGFGALANTSIPPEKRAQLQRSLVRSHAAGSGPEVEREVVRATMLLRLSTLATGRTGVALATAQAYADLLNAGITPVVHEYGSLGCSGDLAPLAHCALAVMGEGKVRVGPSTPSAECVVADTPNPSAECVVVDAADALASAGLAPVQLAEKEGLALINGTDGMLGMLILALHDLDNLLATADIAAAMSVEGQLGTDDVFAADLHALRPQLGQAKSAENLRKLMADSAIRESHRLEVSKTTHSAEGGASTTTHSADEGAANEVAACTRVQDAYSLRCSPQVHGSARDTCDHAALIAGRELSAAIDNPVVTLDGRVESNGNFHGAPVAHVLDFLAVVTADVASIAERRTDRFLDVARNHGLPPFLADDPGTDSGHMIAQYTQAAIVSELKRLANPASVDSIPSSAMQEDHVSMGWSAARKLRKSIDGLTQVLAIEILTAARALDLRAPLQPAPATAAVVALLRGAGIKGPGPDRFLSPEIQLVNDLVASGQVRSGAERVTGPLN